MSESVEIGVRLREFGLKKFSTLKAFSDALGIIPQNLNNYLTGRQRPGNKMKHRLRELGCDIDWLMTGKSASQSISQTERELLDFLKEVGIDSIEKARELWDPEGIAKDFALVLRERLQKYRAKRPPNS